MARPRRQDPRFDHRGGVNTAYSEEILDATELRRAKNVRVGHGDLAVRGGSQRVHTGVLASGQTVLGVHQWDSPAGAQLVAIAGGNLFHKLDADAAFTELDAALTTTRRPIFEAAREGAAIVLYIADGALRKWDGAALTSAIDNAPAAVDVAIYKGRLYAHTGTKRLYGSKPFDYSVFSVAEGGIFADVETYDTEGLVRIGVIGGVLALFKEQNTARFTGVDVNDIRLDTQTTGLSNELGLLAPASLVLVENGAFGVSAKGPAWWSENGAERIGEKILPAITDANREAWRNAVASHLQDRQEIHLWIPPAGDTENSEAWVYNYATRAWSGPFEGNAAASATTYVRPDGTLTMLRGGYDGIVREEDVAGTAKDDVLRDGSGGTPIEWEVEYPPLLFGAPERVKSLRQALVLSADLGAAGSEVVAWWASELGSGTTTITSRGAGVQPYPFKFRAAKGARLRTGFRGGSGEPVRLLGWNPNAAIGAGSR